MPDDVPIVKTTGGKVAGWAGGRAAGAAAGAALGSVVPVVGTAIGGLVGGFLGGKAGADMGDSVTDKVSDVKEKVQARNAAQQARTEQQLEGAQDSASRARESAEIATGEPMNLAWRLLKERVSPEAIAHKLAYDKKYESTPERVKYREELNRERRRRHIMGQGGPDMSHTKDHTIVPEDPHTNRARHFKEKGTLL